jgi:hypothetical protein
MRDLAKADRSAANFIEAAISACISDEKRKVALAFHGSVTAAGPGPASGARCEKLRQIIKEIERLKRTDAFSKLLRNLVVIPDFADLGRSLEAAGIDAKPGADLVFAFAELPAKGSLKGVPDGVRTVYIDARPGAEGSYFDKTAFYYPLFEVVTITLLKYLGKDDNRLVDLEGINIKGIDVEDPEAFLVFSLIPKAAPAETGAMRDRYILIKESISSAA